MNSFRVVKTLGAVILGMALWPVIILGALLLAQGWTLPLLVVAAILVVVAHDLWKNRQTDRNRFRKSLR